MASSLSLAKLQPPSFVRSAQNGAADRILLADDSKTVRTVVGRALTQPGYNVITAADGVAAVELAREHRPSLAVLDIVMPGLDGYGVCERLKAMGPPWDQLPIVFLTCVNSKALRAIGKCLRGVL